MTTSMHPISNEMPTGDGHPTAGNVSTRVDYPADPLIGKDQSRGGGQPPLTFTILSATHQQPMTKVLGMKEDGTLRKSTLALLSSGQFAVQKASDLTELARVLESLESHQCVTWGRPDDDTGCVCAKDNAKAIEAGAIPRDRHHYHWPAGPGVWMLDHDGMPDHSLEPDQFRDLLIQAAPCLQHAPMLWRPSASAGCIAPDGRVLSNLDRHRIYIPVRDASLITEAGQALSDLLWAAGLGWCDVSKSGQRLLRCPVDTSVWQPERIDFAAPPVLHNGVQRLESGHRIFCDPLDLFDLADIIAAATPAMQAQAKANQRLAREGVKQAAQEATAQWAGDQAAPLAGRRGIGLDEATQCLVTAATKRLLMGDFELTASDGTVVSVGELLDSPGRWHNQRFYDPLDPDDDGRVACVRLFGTRPMLYSHRHGGVTFDLKRQSTRVQLGKGRRIAVTDQTLKVLQARRELYDFGSAAVAYVTHEGRIVVASRDWLIDHLGRVCSFYSTKVQRDGQGNVTEETKSPEDAPAWLAQSILAKHGEREFRQIDAVITAPTLRLDGDVFDVPGYDSTMRLTYVPLSQEVPRVPAHPTPQDAVAALARLFEPFKTFPFADEDAVGVFLAALLSACLRPSLPTCPGFGFDAPTAGSGKTLLAQCIGWLSTGQEVAVMPPANNDDEMRKRLFACLLSGARVLLWDNLREPLGGASLDAFLTSPVFADRTLGKSEIPTLPNKALFMCSGNNITLTGDTYRRVLLCRIDPKSETPYKREFHSNPLTHVKNQRLQMVCDALTVVRAWINAGCPRSAPGNMASFEDWDRLVRQPLMWLAPQIDGKVPGYVDPMSGVDRTAAANPENALLGALLTAWVGQFGNRPATAKETIQAAQHNVTLRDALEDVSLACGGEVSPRTLGNWLTKHLGRPVQGNKFTRTSGQGGVYRWLVVSTNSQPAGTTHPNPLNPPPAADAEDEQTRWVGSVGWSGLLLTHPDTPLETDVLH